MGFYWYQQFFLTHCQFPKEDHIYVELLLFCLSRKPLLPIESELLPSDDSGGSEEECNTDKYCGSMVQIKKNLVSRAKININCAQARYKRDFDKKHQHKKVCMQYAFMCLVTECLCM